MGPGVDGFPGFEPGITTTEPDHPLLEPGAPSTPTPGTTLQGGHRPDIRPVGEDGIPQDVQDNSGELADSNEDARLFNEALDSVDSQTCNAAVTTLRDYVTQERLKTYIDSCWLESLLDFGNFGLTENQQKAILRNTGYFTKDDLEPFCSGVLVGQRLYTARHCVSEIEKGGERVNFTFYDPTLPVLSRFSVNDLSCQNIHSSSDELPFQACDYAEIIPENAPHYSSLNFSGSAKQFQRLLIPAFNPYFYEIHKNELTSSTNSRTWLQGVSWTNHPFCSVNKRLSPKIISGDTVLDRTCYRHNCQTLGRASGAPMFTLQNSRLQLVGLHIGSTYQVTNPALKSWQANNLCAPLDTSLTKSSNLGISIPHHKE